MNLFNGRAGATGHGPGGAVAGDLHCVRPHELDMVADAAADDDTWGADLAQMLTLGPVTRLEFRRADGSDVDVELPRERWMQLRTALQLAPGARARLKPRRITRFTSAADTPLESNPTAVG